MLKGFTRLLNNPLQQTYLPNSAKKVSFHQELLVYFWKCCEYNKVRLIILFFFYLISFMLFAEVYVLRAKNQ